MRRLSTLAIVVFVGVAASCQKPPAGQTVQVASAADDSPVASPEQPPRDTVAVTVTCPTTADALGGVTVRPWTVHVATSDPAELAWDLTPGDLPVAIEPVDWEHWPFARRPIQYSPSGAAAPHANVRAVVRRPQMQTRYRYRLTITCRDGQVIVIDPVVIVDPA